MSACHKYLDREDLWVRFAILFSLRVINQLHAHPGYSVGLRHTHAHAHTHAQKCSLGPACHSLGWEKELSRELSSRKGKSQVPNCCLAIQDPRTIQNQALKTGSQDVPMVGETAHLVGLLV